MIRKALTLTLLEDTAISASATSTGSHRSLGYIPGAKLLGVVAQGYAGFANPWDVFHSGRVRFGNAYPAPDGTRSLPIARCWTDSDDEGAITALPSKYRDEFFGQGRTIRARTVRRQKTANSRGHRGAVREGFFFDISALARGQQFVAVLEIDDGLGGLEDDILARLDGKEFTIGRSRSAEFGRIKCEIGGTLDPAPLAPVAGRSTVQIYCAADVDVPLGGDPARVAQAFGLPPAWERKGKTPPTRRMSGFNTHRQLFTTEREVIQRGAMLTFAGPALTDDQADAMRARTEAGVGAGRAEGLGAVLVQPDFLSTAPKTTYEVPETQAAPPTDALFKWATKRSGQAARAARIAEYVRGYHAPFVELYRQAQTEAEVSGQLLKDLSPGRAQWGEVRNIAQRGGNASALEDALFGERNGLTYGSQTRRAWDFLGVWEGERTSFRDLLRQVVDLPEDHDPETPDDGERAARLLTLATDMPRLMADMVGEPA